MATASKRSARRPPERRAGRGHLREAVWSPDFDRPRRSRASSYAAFIPDEIADFEPQFSASTAELLFRSADAVKELNARDSAPASLEGLARQLLRSEALASSQIEGLSVSHRKLAEAALRGEGSHRAQEVLANMHAMEKAIEVGTQADPIEDEDLAAIHRELAIAPPLDRIAGEFRREQGWIGGEDPPHAEFVPAPPGEIPRLVADLCEFMNRDDLPAVAQAAIAHAQFETIHPFGDGNGRVGRALIHALLRRRRTATRYVPPVSLVLGANKDAYVAGLTAFRADEVERWTAQFARALETSARHAEGFTERVNALQDKWIRRAEPMRADAAAREVIANLPAFPYISVKIVQEFTGKSHVAALRALEHLTEAGILTRHTNRKRGDSWEAKELFALLADFERTVKRP